eukprot:379823_1
MMSFFMVKIIDKDYDVDVGTVVEKVFEDYQRAYHTLLGKQVKKQMGNVGAFSIPQCSVCGKEMLIKQTSWKNCNLGDHRGYEYVWMCVNHSVTVYYCMPCGMKWKNKVNVQKDTTKTKDLETQTQNEIELTTKNEE